MAQITNLTRILAWLVLAGASGALLIAASAYLYLSPNLPPVDVLRDVKLQTPMRILSADMQLIGEFGEKRRSPLEYDQVPTTFVNAILAAEDDRFFEHHGVDITGLLRAASQLLTTGSIQSGGSTITMQVAKNYFLSRERTFSRKFNEILLALQIERELPKAEILQLYLNKIFLGNRAYGFEAAAQVYYGQPLTELTLPQWAMLAGLPKAPSAYNPLVNPSRALERRDWILGRMFSLDYIDQDTLQDALKTPITARFHGAALSQSAPYIAEMARSEMIERFGKDVYTAGYRVITTVDSQLQAAAHKAVVEGLMAYDKRHGYRGPEQNVAALNDGQDTERWLDALQGISAPGGLVPAIVTQLHEQAFNALLADGQQILIDWQQGLEGKRLFETIDRLSAKPDTAGDVVAVGDLVRLQPQEDGSWQLVQLPEAQAALVSLDANNGEILSLVGGFDYNQSKFNRITQAKRQPGSNFKPFIYTAALANGYTPASIINDAPIVFEDAGLESSWRPTNDSGKFYGPTRLRYALFKSRNLVSIRLLRALGIPKAIEYTTHFGFDSSELPKDLSLALGSHSLHPMQIVKAYAVLANGGYQVEPYLIDRVETIDGEIIYQTYPSTVCIDCDKPESNESLAQDESAIEEFATIEDLLQDAEPQASAEGEAPTQETATPEPLPIAPRTIEPRVAYIIDSMMRDVVKKGTGRAALKLGRNDLAGKTGTTNGPTDAWFSGYGGGVVTTTWLGFDRNNVLGRREYGGSAALPIWIDYMRAALEGRPEILVQQPEGIVTVKVDPATGLLAKPGQSNAIFEIFRAEYAPTEETTNEDANGPQTDVEELLEEDIF